MSVLKPSMKPSFQPQTTFFDLSRELRDHCYNLALTTPDPIIAWSGIRTENSESLKAKWDFRRDLEAARQFKITTVDVRITAPNLLRCNSVVAQEAALIFYGKNKFVFAGDWTWDTVVNWFGNIGPRNRSFVTSIELWQHQPSHAWQIANGERVGVVEFDWEPLEPPFPRNRYLYGSLDLMSEGLVDNINPAIETFFELTSTKRHSKLLLTFSLRRSLIPGVETDPGCEESPNHWFSMDLPNIVERLRTTTKHGLVDVVWKGDLLRELFLEKREDIESHWEILDLEEFEFVRPPRNSKLEARTWHCALHNEEQRTPRGVVG